MSDASPVKALAPWSPNDYMQLNVDFHAAVVALAENEFLTAQLTLIRMTTTVFAPAVLICPERARPAVEAHHAVAVAIAAGDGGAAERLARQHIGATVQCLLDVEAAQLAR